MKKALLGIIRLYRYFISPLFPPSCRFTPTCSEYALVAIDKFGIRRGVWLACKRFAACAPGGGSGLDPVPTLTHNNGRGCGG